MVEIDKIRGIYKVKTDDKEVGFKFGMATWFILSKDLNMNVNDLQEKLTSGDISSIIDIFYAAYKAYCRYKKEDPKLDEYDISDVMDDIGMDEMTKLLEKGFETFGTKKKKVRQTVKRSTK